MNKKHLAITILIAIIVASGTYLLSPTEEPSGGTNVDPAQKAAGLFNRLIESYPSLSGSKIDARTVINGRAVPPMPDKTQNAATIAGIDTDKNGIRDDIDRHIAELFGGDPKYDDVVIYEKAFEYALSYPSVANTARAINEADCVLKFIKLPNGKMTMQPDSVYKKMSILTHLTVNTPDRGRVYANSWAGVGEGSCLRK